MSSSHDYDVILALPFGPFGICFKENKIWEMVFLPPGTPPQNPTTDVAIDTATRIHNWITAPNTALILPVHTRGTPFQQRVWEQIRTIPAGQTTTYGTLALRLNSIPRAIGQACGANPFPLATPCHRIIAATGIGGFSHASDGFLLQAKRWLLHNEVS